jgi:hypothetical protein
VSNVIAPFRVAISAVALSVGLAACAAPSDPGDAPATSAPALPKEARLDDAGMLNIGNVAPTPFAATPPEDRSTHNDEIARFARQYGMTRDEAYTAMMSNGPESLAREIGTLGETLRRREAGNYVDMIMVREPDVKVEVWFKRDAAQTLARYTSNPRFVPRTGGLDAKEADALRDSWMKRLNEAGLDFGGGVDARKGVLELSVGVDEAQFDDTARTQGFADWRDAPLDITFMPPQKPALREEAAGLEQAIHIFPRTRQGAITVLSVANYGRVTLDGGCFRFAGFGEKDGALAVFDRNTQLGLDEQGYLTVFAAIGDDRARVGEEFVFGGYATPDESDPDIVALREKCGNAPLINVGVPEAKRLFDAPGAAAVTGYAKRKGLSRQAAWDEITQCFRSREEEATARIEKVRQLRAAGQEVLPDPPPLPEFDCMGFSTVPPPPPPAPPPPPSAG